MNITYREYRDKLYHDIFLISYHYLKFQYRPAPDCTCKYHLKQEILYNANVWWGMTLVNSYFFAFFIVHNINGFGYLCTIHYYSHVQYEAGWTNDTCSRYQKCKSIWEKPFKWHDKVTNVVVDLYWWRRPFEFRKSQSERIRIRNILKLATSRLTF